MAGGRKHGEVPAAECGGVGVREGEEDWLKREKLMPAKMFRVRV